MPPLGLVATALGLVLALSSLAGGDATPTPAPRVIDLKAPDGTLLKATFYPAAKPGPGVLLLHQVNRTRETWGEVATQLASAGVSALTLDMRGHGGSGGTPVDKLSPAEAGKHWRGWPEDVDVALASLASQPGVRAGIIGLAGAGLLGVDNSVEAARRHETVKSLALLSGETFQEGLDFLHQASYLPELFVVADGDEYPPTVEAMDLLYLTASSPGRRLVHYSAAHEAPWLWYEPYDLAKVPATGNHGTDLFKGHPELPGIIVDWFVTTLVKNPGHAPADSLAAAPIINEIRSGGLAQVRQRLIAARETDPQVQLFPEVTVSIIGQDYMRSGDPKSALEVFELVLLAYPDSADAHESVAEACLEDGKKELARRHVEKALAMLDSHAAPASSWSDTEPYRGELRRAVERLMKKLGRVP